MQSFADFHQCASKFTDVSDIREHFSKNSLHVRGFIEYRLLLSLASFFIFSLYICNFLRIKEKKEKEKKEMITVEKMSAVE